MASVGQLQILNKATEKKQNMGRHTSQVVDDWMSNYFLNVDDFFSLFISHVLIFHEQETFLLRGKKGGLDRPLSNQDSVNGGGGTTPLASPYKHRFSRSSESGSHLSAGHFQSGTTTPVSPVDLEREPFHGK